MLAFLEDGEKHSALQLPNEALQSQAALPLGEFSLLLALLGPADFSLALN